ncbi:MAG: ATP-binding protein [Ferruginibacter sp.]
MPAFASAQHYTQQWHLNDLHSILKTTSNDTVRMETYLKLGIYYDDVNLDSAVYYGEKGITIARQLKLKLYEAEMLMNTSFPLTKMGNYPKALKVLTQALDIAENPANEHKTWHLLNTQTPRTYRLTVLGYSHLSLSTLYSSTGNYEKRIAEINKGKEIAEAGGDSMLLAFFYGEIGFNFLDANRFDSALFYQQKALDYFSSIPISERKFEAGFHSSIGDVYAKMGDTNPARKNYETAVAVALKQNNTAQAGYNYIELAKIYKALNKQDSGLSAAKNALAAFTLVGKEKEKVLAYRMISDFYREKNLNDSSFIYLRLATLLNDSINITEKKKLQEFQIIGFNEQIRFQNLENERIETQNKIRTYSLLAGLGVFLLIGILLYRNNVQRKKANKVLEKTLTHLKSTQSQLIQSEKMASLGELTAGIAHEIQNPLNFVNNFSEVSNELIDEMNVELDKGDIEEAKAIAADVKQNLEKINHHGKRADAIVKGMLQHSCSSSGVKEPTDINALCDEYLRLSYHGLRAKDKSFNATIKTDFDDSFGKINIIPQDIGRVVLNLLTNAFYAVDEKKKTGIENYEPTVSISTKKIGDNVEIRVSDNGNGIPPKALDKIFQPFFTTKPTGQGTGLGLSLSYDIVKAHGGEITVESAGGERTTFKILLPLNN